MLSRDRSCAAFCSLPAAQIHRFVIASSIGSALIGVKNALTCESENGDVYSSNHTLYSSAYKSEDGVREINTGNSLVEVREW